MEEKIYDRQVSKQSLSARVVDEHQIERHFSMNELAELYEFNDEPDEQRPTPKVPKDLMLAELLKKHEKLIWKFHDHDSLLENQVDENLTEEERKAAWDEFENEKKGFVNFNSPVMQNTLLSQLNPQVIQEQYRKQYPGLTDEQVFAATRAFIMQVQSGLHRRPAYDKSHYQQVGKDLFGQGHEAIHVYFSLAGDGQSQDARANDVSQHVQHPEKCLS